MSVLSICSMYYLTGLHDGFKQIDEGVVEPENETLKLKSKCALVF